MVFVLLSSALLMQQSVPLLTSPLVAVIATMAAHQPSLVIKPQMYKHGTSSYICIYDLTPLHKTE